MNSISNENSLYFNLQSPFLQTVTSSKLVIPSHKSFKTIEMQRIEPPSTSQQPTKGIGLILKANQLNNQSQKPISPKNSSNTTSKRTPLKKENPEKLGWIDQLYRVLIRPPNRFIYSPSNLGPINFVVNGNISAKREDFKVKSSRGFILECSYFEAQEIKEKRHPCVMYLHGNSSSRCEGIQLIQYLIPYGISLILMDFAGCGISEGEYISLGYYEKFDAKIVMDYIKEKKNITEFGLWGRSMGAATTIMTALNEDPSIRYIVVDSSFTSLHRLCKEIGTQKFCIPSCLFSYFYNYIRKKIKEKALFDLNDCDPLKVIQSPKNKPNALFLIALQDTLIPPTQCQQLFDSYQGKKRIIQFEGTHNSKRQKEINQEILKFFFNGLFDDYGINKLLSFQMIPSLPNFNQTEISSHSQFNQILNKNQMPFNKVDVFTLNLESLNLPLQPLSNFRENYSKNNFQGTPYLIKQQKNVIFNKIKPKQENVEDDMPPENQGEEQNNTDEHLQYMHQRKGIDQFPQMESHHQISSSRRSENMKPQEDRFKERFRNQNESNCEYEKNKIQSDLSMQQIRNEIKHENKMQEEADRCKQIIPTINFKENAQEIQSQPNQIENLRASNNTTTFINLISHQLNKNEIDESKLEKFQQTQQDSKSIDVSYSNCGHKLNIQN